MKEMCVVVRIASNKHFLIKRRDERLILTPLHDEMGTPLWSCLSAWRGV